MRSSNNEFPPVRFRHRYKELHRRHGLRKWIGPSEHVKWENESVYLDLSDVAQEALWGDIFEFRDTMPNILVHASEDERLPMHVREICKCALASNPDSEDAFKEWLRDNFCV